ncbi:MAG: hypothetical protein ABDH18_03150 [Aquificaceae bacterium]
MKLTLWVITLLILAGILGTGVFLNPQVVRIVLTPAFDGVYYYVELPLGVAVFGGMVFGAFVGYILNSLWRL